MRVTESYMVNSLQNNVDSSLTNLNILQQQLSTGKKLNSPSDDPSGASLVMSLKNSLADNAQYKRNQDQATSFLQLTDTALGDANNIINQVRQIAVSAANSTQTPDSLQAFQSQLDGLATELSNVANTNLHGKYLFSGTLTQTAPFNPTDPTHTYNGNTGTVMATLGPGDTQAISTPGSTIFSAAFASITALKTNIASGNITSISASIAAIDSNLSTVNVVRSNVGAQENQVTTISERMARASIEFQDTISNVQDTDLATTYVQLQSAQNVYQASLAATAKAYKYSLTDFLG